MYVVKKKKDEIYSLPVKELKAGQLKVLGSTLAQDIVSTLERRAHYPKELALVLGQHEQKIYYHIRKLEKAGIIEIVKKEIKQGATAQYYGLTEKSFLLRFAEFKHQPREVYANESDFLFPFIKNGELNATIVVGSPDPHGPGKARSRDGYYGMDFALFLGTFLNRVEKLQVKLDTEVNTDTLQDNLIIIGGPIVNHTTSLINKRLPIHFEGKKVVSKLSGKEYSEEEIGIIVKTKNPFNKDKYVLLLAGMRHSGTRACILAFLQQFDVISKGNKSNPKIMAHVVEGVDTDYDGVIDGVEVKE